MAFQILTCPHLGFDNIVPKLFLLQSSLSISDCEIPSLFRQQSQASSLSSHIPLSIYHSLDGSTLRASPESETSTVPLLHPSLFTTTWKTVLASVRATLFPAATLISTKSTEGAFQNAKSDHTPPPTLISSVTPVAPQSKSSPPKTAKPYIPWIPFSGTPVPSLSATPASVPGTQAFSYPKAFRPAVLPTWLSP